MNNSPGFLTQEVYNVNGNYNTISIRRPAPSWLVSLIGRGLHRYRRGHEFFSGFLFATAKVAYILCDDHPSFNSSHCAVYIYDFHVFKTSIQSLLLKTEFGQAICCTVTDRGHASNKKLLQRMKKIVAANKSICRG